MSERRKEKTRRSLKRTGRHRAAVGRCLIAAAVLWMLAADPCKAAGSGHRFGATETAARDGQPSGSGDTGGLSGLEDFDFSQINRFLQRETRGASITMESVMRHLVEGDLSGLGREIWETVCQALFLEISTGSRLMGQVLTLGFVGAVFTNFSTVLDRKSVV